MWAKFVVENDAILEGLVELGENENFSSSEELETNRWLVSAKAWASRLVFLNVSNESSVLVNVSESDAEGNSEATTKSIGTHPVVESVVRSSQLVRLPEIPLPRFEGDLADWPDFGD